MVQVRTLDARVPFDACRTSYAGSRRCCICVLYVAYAYCMLHMRVACCICVLYVARCISRRRRCGAGAARWRGSALAFYRCPKRRASRCIASSRVASVATHRPMASSHVASHVASLQCANHRSLRPSIASLHGQWFTLSFNVLRYHSMFCAIIQCFTLSFNVLLYHSMLRRIVAHCTPRHRIASLPAAAPNRFRGSRKRSTRASGGSFSSSHGRQCACPTPTRRTLCGARRWRSSICMPAC